MSSFFWILSQAIIVILFFTLYIEWHILREIFGFATWFLATILWGAWALNIININRNE